MNDQPDPDPKTSDHLPPLAFELLLAGTAPGDPERRWREHLQGCPPCRERLAEARALGESWARSPEADRVRRLLAATPPAAGVRRANRPLSLTLRWRRWWTLGLALPVAALTAWLWIVPARPPAPAVAFVARGNGVLGLTVERGGQIEVWPAPAQETPVGPLRAGDRVQLTWSAPRSGHLVVLALDRDGDVHRLFPEAGPAGAPVAAGGPRPVGPSLQIDPGTAPLRVWAVFSERPVAVGPLLDRLTAGGAPVGEAGQQVVTIRALHRERPPAVKRPLLARTLVEVSVVPAEAARLLTGTSRSEMATALRRRAPTTAPRPPPLTRSPRAPIARRRDGIHLQQKVGVDQLRHLHQGARGSGTGRQEPVPDLAKDRHLGDIPDVPGDLDDIPQARPHSLQRHLQVLEDLLRLSPHVVLPHHLALPVERHLTGQIDRPTGRHVHHVRVPPRRRHPGRVDEPGTSPAMATGVATTNHPKDPDRQQPLWDRSHAWAPTDNRPHHPARGAH